MTVKTVDGENVPRRKSGLRPGDFAAAFEL
jgi:hypothetical protein